MRSQAAISPDGQPHELPDMLHGARDAAALAWERAAEKALAKHHRLNRSHGDLVELGARAEASGLALAESRPAMGRAGGMLYAKDICPWFFDPPVAASTDSLMVCYAGRCNPQAEGIACCKEKGGVFKCPLSRPFMCSDKDCGGDRCCTRTAAECGLHGGRRRCEGPPGPSGRAGAAGHAGANAKGDRGPAGDPGPVGEVSLHGSGSKASKGAFFGVLAANMVLAWVVLQCFASAHGKTADQQAGDGDAEHDELQEGYDEQDYEPPAEGFQAEPR